ncbi:Glucose-6-phosphate exchanger SLC37A2 [Nymphon striatum]|nr:Glucose-6-phosphate exchanger SLC37A2 [Nymphon striatum]
MDTPLIGCKNKNKIPNPEYISRAESKDIVTDFDVIDAARDVMDAVRDVIPVACEALPSKMLLLLWLRKIPCFNATAATREALSVLNKNCTSLNSSVHHNNSYWCDWAPFGLTNVDVSMPFSVALIKTKKRKEGDTDASELLGGLDSSFLFSYAICMFFSGYLAERSNLRYYLTGGMLLSALSVFLFGLGDWLNIHSFAYYVVVMIVGGIFQTSGWPAVVTCVGNWFGKKKRGFIFGVWNSHTSFGNILGSYFAGLFVEYNWGYSFVVPAIIMASFAIIVFLFLTPCNTELQRGRNPLSATGSDRLWEAHNDVTSGNPGLADETSPMVDDSLSTSLTHSDSPRKAISLLGALRIPGVLEFSGCLLFAKLVSYTFLYWLPRYINATDKYSPTVSANLSTAFDFGGILGGILAGLISDSTGGSATICIVMLLCSTPMLYGYKYFVTFTMSGKFGYLFATGMFVNGPYALITTAVATELGTSSKLQGNSKALSTVTAIIDGTGSLGAAVGPLLAGFLSPGGWENVFYMLIGAEFIAAAQVLPEFDSPETLSVTYPVVTSSDTNSSRATIDSEYTFKDSSHSKVADEAILGDMSVPFIFMDILEERLRLEIDNAKNVKNKSIFNLNTATLCSPEVPIYGLTGDDELVAPDNYQFVIVDGGALIHTLPETTVHRKSVNEYFIKVFYPRIQPDLKRATRVDVWDQYQALSIKDGTRVKRETALIFVPSNLSSNVYSLSEVEEICKASGAHLPLPMVQGDKDDIMNLAMAKGSMSVVMTGVRGINDILVYPNGEEYNFGEFHCNNCFGIGYLIYKKSGSNVMVPSAILTEATSYSFVLPVCEK